MSPWEKQPRAFKVISTFLWDKRMYYHLNSCNALADCVFKFIVILTVHHGLNNVEHNIHAHGALRYLNHRLQTNQHAASSAGVNLIEFRLL